MPASPPARTSTKCRGGSIAAVSLRSMTANPANVRYRWPACIAPTLLAQRCVRSTASTPRRTQSCCTARILCIGCGYCFYACPFGAPQYPKVGNFGSRGKMDKCTYCAGGPEPDGSKAQYEKYGANRLAEGKLPLCAEMCSTKSLLAGDGEVIAQIYKERVSRRGYGSGAWGWQTAYGETIAT